MSFASFFCLINFIGKGQRIASLLRFSFLLIVYGEFAIYIKPELFVLSYYVSLRSEFRVVMSVTISA